MLRWTVNHGTELQASEGQKFSKWENKFDVTNFGRHVLSMLGGDAQFNSYE
jgi:hypothetical protein